MRRRQIHRANAEHVPLNRRQETFQLPSSDEIDSHAVKVEDPLQNT